MPDIQDIIKGTDISSHYLNNETQKQFKLYRYEHAVYAISLQTPKSPIAVEMWKSEHVHNLAKAQKTEKDNANLIIGAGKEGDIELKQKNLNKVTKKINNARTPSPTPSEEICQGINQTLLEQKFTLVKAGIDQHFIIGLWNTKEKDPKKYSEEDRKPLFIMPRVIGKRCFATTSTDQQEPDNTKQFFKFDPALDNMFRPIELEAAEIVEKQDRQRKIDEFIIALKKLNELNLSHPDYALNIKHQTFNAMVSDSAVVLIDLDGGFATIDRSKSNEDVADQKDQWLYACNYKNAAIIQWKEKNPDKALSDNIDDLLKMRDKIHLPEHIVQQLKLMRLCNDYNKHLSYTADANKGTDIETSCLFKSYIVAALIKSFNNASPSNASEQFLLHLKSVVNALDPKFTIEMQTIFDLKSQSTAVADMGNHKQLMQGIKKSNLPIPDVNHSNK